MRQDTVIRTINIGREAVARLEFLAAEQDTSVSELVRQAVGQYLSEYPFPRHPKETKREEDTGRITPYEKNGKRETRRWAIATCASVCGTLAVQSE